MQGDAKAVELAFVHVGQDLEEQQELLECLLAFVLQLLLADDDVACLLPGQRPPHPAHIIALHHIGINDVTLA